MVDNGFRPETGIGEEIGMAAAVSFLLLLFKKVMIVVKLNEVEAEIAMLLDWLDSCRDAAGSGAARAICALKQVNKRRRRRRLVMIGW